MISTFITLSVSCFWYISPHRNCWCLLAPSSLSLANVSCISRPNPSSSLLRIRFRLIHAVCFPFRWLNSSLRSHPRQPITCAIQGHLGSYARFVVTNSLRRRSQNTPWVFTGVGFATLTIPSGIWVAYVMLGAIAKSRMIVREEKSDTKTCVDTICRSLPYIENTTLGPQYSIISCKILRFLLQATCYMDTLLLIAVVVWWNTCVGISSPKSLCYLSSRNHQHQR